MIHPSYKEMMEAVNKGQAVGEEPVVNSRYAICLAVAKRARQLTTHPELAKIEDPKCDKPLSIAVEEIYTGKVKIKNENEGTPENRQ